MIQYDTNRGFCISSTEYLPGKTKRFRRQRGLECQIFSFSGSYKDNNFVLENSVSYDGDDVVQTNAWMRYFFALLLYSVYFLA